MLGNIGPDYEVFGAMLVERPKGKVYPAIRKVVTDKYGETRLTRDETYVLLYLMSWQGQERTVRDLAFYLEGDDSFRAMARAAKSVHSLRRKLRKFVHSRLDYKNPPITKRYIRVASCSL